MRFVLPLALLTLTTSLAAEAATISASKQGYISIVGEIVPGDELAFADELKTFTPARPAEVRLDSRGGSVVTALMIAEIVHKAGLTCPRAVPGAVLLCMRNHFRSSPRKDGECRVNDWSALGWATCTGERRDVRGHDHVGASHGGIRSPAFRDWKNGDDPYDGNHHTDDCRSRSVEGNDIAQFCRTAGTTIQASGRGCHCGAMVRFVVGPDNSIDRAMQFFSWPWDEKVRYIKSVGGQHSKICFKADDCIHKTEALTFNRKYSYAVRSNPRITQKAFCVTSFERGREACYIEGSDEVLFLYNSDGQWKKVPPSTALSMID